MYDALRYVSTYYTFTNGSAPFDTLQVRIPHITVYYIRRHILITFVTVLHLNTPQWPIESEFIREQSHFIAIKNEWPLVTSNLNLFDVTFPSIILERMTQDSQVRCITVYFDVLHVYNRFCCNRHTASTNSSYYRILFCKHILITFVTLLHLITPQWPIASEFIREPSYSIGI